MEDEKRTKDMTPEEKVEESQEDVRELSDKTLEDVAGGTIPIIDAF